MRRGTGCQLHERERAEEYLRAFDPEKTRSFRRRKRGVRADIGEIYFISRIGDPTYPVKIGFSAGATYYRLKNIQVGSPWPLEIVGRCAAHHSLERRLHDRLEPLKLAGEWFARGALVSSALLAAQGGELAGWLQAS